MIKINLASVESRIIARWQKIINTAQRALTIALIAVIGAVAVLELLAIYNNGFFKTVIMAANIVWWWGSVALGSVFSVWLNNSESEIKWEPIVFTIFSAAMTLLAIIGIFEFKAQFFSLFMNTVFFGLVFVCAVWNIAKEKL